MVACYISVAVLLYFGGKLLLFGWLFRDVSWEGHRTLRKIGGYRRSSRDIWNSPALCWATDLAARFVFLDERREEALAKRLVRAGLPLTPQRFLARKYLLIGSALLGVLLCVLLKFWLGVVLVLLLMALGLMKQRDALESGIRHHDEAIAVEMPRFVRTVCRNLMGNRDVYAAICSYRKVAGSVLGEELDILLAHMRSGNMTTALQTFENRLGTEEAFRFCSALLEIERGIDQTATLDYLASDMARQAKYNLQKQLAKRPGQMRRTYFPAVGICVLMILYVLLQFVLSQLSTLF